MQNYQKGEKALYLVGSAGQNRLKATLPNQDESFTRVHFVSDLKGWIFTQQSIYLTEDGAKTWTKLALPRPQGLVDTFAVGFIQPLGFGTSSIGFLSVVFESYEPSYQRLEYIYGTVDSGRTWRVYGDAKPKDTNQIAQIDVWHLSNAVPLRSNPGQTAAEANIAKLQLGKWKTERLSLPGTCSGCFVSRLSDKTIFLSNYASDPRYALDLFKTTDGGLTWVKVGSTPGREG